MYITAVSLISKTIDILFPPRCLNCNQMVNSIGSLCSDCWKNIDFISSPCCYICSNPFEYFICDGALCVKCIKQKPDYQKAYILFKYNEYSKKLIHKLKYCDCTYLAPYLAKLLYPKISEVKADYIAPVPIHKYRLFKRFYNQALLLARPISQFLNTPLIPDLLIKTKNIVSQSSLRGKERKKNIVGAFILNPKYIDLVKDKRILLVDDVVTTGATINYCCSLLTSAGAKNIEIIALGKTCTN